MNAPAISVSGLGKSFVLHLRAGATLPVVSDVGFTVEPGECVVLSGPSGVGKSSVLKMIYGNYRADRGVILIKDGESSIDVAAADPRRIMALRRSRMAYVSQFLRVIPRVSALDLVAEPLIADGVAAEEARERASTLLQRLNLPRRLWHLPPATFSGGEQARVNIARGLAPDRSILLLDEPTASLDPANRSVVAELAAEKKRRGAAILGIFHDDEMRDRIADRIVDMTRFAGAPGAKSRPKTARSVQDDMVLANAVLVLPDRVIERGWLSVTDGLIAEFGPGEAPRGGQDCGGDILIPGLIELHTDHLESHFAPRPKVRWHPLSAVLAYDAQMASSGITTVFDSLRVGSDADSASIGEDLMILAEAIAVARDANLLRAEHRTHLRCEIASPNVTDQIEDYVARYPAHMISLMDHTPGQRQFTSLKAWKAFYVRKTPYTDAELDGFIEQKLATHARYAEQHRTWLADFAGRHGIVLASHDDATTAHVAESVGNGVRIAEFPTTLEAAEASHAAGLKIMMGGPNVIRGGSHSGNVAACDLARAGLLDILSSDYVPASLLMAAFDLPRRVPGISLPEAVNMVTLNPAKATGLEDRGAIETGKRADLVRVARHEGGPVVREVFRSGVRIA